MLLRHYKKPKKKFIENNTTILSIKRGVKKIINAYWIKKKIKYSEEKAYTSTQESRTEKKKIVRTLMKLTLKFDNQYNNN